MEKCGGSGPGSLGLLGLGGSLYDLSLEVKLFIAGERVDRTSPRVSAPSEVWEGGERSTS